MAKAKTRWRNQRREKAKIRQACNGMAYGIGIEMKAKAASAAAWHRHEKHQSGEKTAAK